MSPMFSTIAKSVRAAAIALGLGAAALTAMPAQAAFFGHPHFGHPHFAPPPFAHPMFHPRFPHFGRPFNPGFGFGFGFYPGYVAPYPGFVCMSDFQVRRAIGASGYFNVSLNVPSGNYIQARGTRGSWVYLIDYDRCGGYIIDVHPLRHG